MAASTSDKLQTGAYFFLAGGFILSAASALMKVREQNALGGLSRGSLPQGAKGKTVEGSIIKGAAGKPKTTNYDVKDIDTRAALIAKLIRQGSLNSDFREAIVGLMSQKCDVLGRVQENGAGSQWCVREKDCMGEVRALFNAVRNPKSKYAIRYIRDNLIADVFTGAERTLLKTHGGDCDDYVVTVGAALLTIGHPVMMRIVAVRKDGVPDNEAPWSHIYLRTPTAFDDPDATWISMGSIRRLQAHGVKTNKNTSWLTVDASMDRELGWEAPGAKEVARTGKAAGIIARVRDYNVVRPGDEA